MASLWLLLAFLLATNVVSWSIRFHWSAGRSGISSRAGFAAFAKKKAIISPFDTTAQPPVSQTPTFLHFLSLYDMQVPSVASLSTGLPDLPLTLANVEMVLDEMRPYLRADG